MDFITETQVTRVPDCCRPVSEFSVIFIQLMKHHAEMNTPVNKDLEIFFYETFEKELSCHIDRLVKEEDERNYSFMAALRPSK